MLLQKLQQFMYGRYGGDKLNFVLLIAGLVLAFVGRLFFWPLILVANVFYIYALFRMFSRNIPARQKEYYGFLGLWQPVAAWCKLQVQKASQMKSTKYFRCPNCRQQLRAPRGRGKIEVTCQKCRKVFTTRT